MERSSLLLRVPCRLRAFVFVTPETGSELGSVSHARVPRCTAGCPGSISLPSSEAPLEDSHTSIVFLGCSNSEKMRWKIEKVAKEMTERKSELVSNPKPLAEALPH